jgi:Sulfotransferase domain
MWAYLTRHPDICGADEKEVGYFNYYNPRRHTGEPPSVESYARHFAHCGDQRYALDATPTYSYGGRPVIEAVQRILDRPKIIITLRNPVDRLFSAYTFQRTLGNITGLQTFEEYLRICESRKRDGSDLVPRDHFHGLYIGYYADYIGLWLDAFGDDLKVIFVENVSRDPHRVLSGLFEWLEIDTEALSAMDLSARNKTQHARSPRMAKAVFSLKRSTERLGLVPAGLREPLRSAYERINAGSAPRLDPETRRHVEDLYRDSNRATAQALTSHGYQDLPDWLQVAASA